MFGVCFRILAKPQLHSEIDSGPLGKLLPEKLLKSLEDEYLSNQQVTWGLIYNALRRIDVGRLLT